MPEQEERHYSIPDADMLELSSTMREFFIEDKADFIARNPKFDDPYAGQWEEKITAAEGFPTDEQVDDILQQKTNAVEAVMTQCRNKFQDTKEFIEDAFPKKQVVWNEFGYDDYDSVRQDQAKFIQFMNRFHKVAVKYSEQLMDANYTQPKIDEIETLAEALKDANTEQEVYKGNIPVITQNRVEVMNACYAVTSEVGRVGKLIYRSNYGKYQRYLLTPSDESPDVFSIIGTVTDAATGEALAGVAVSIESLGINTSTDSEGKYGFGALDDGTYEVHAHKDGYQDATVNAEVAGDEPVVADIAMVAV